MGREDEEPQSGGCGMDDTGHEAIEEVEMGLGQNSVS
jgi:hypothetical protein